MIKYYNNMSVEDAVALQAATDALDAAYRDVERQAARQAALWHEWHNMTGDCDAIEFEEDWLVLHKAALNHRGEP
jgi:hypothetical protein